MSKVKMRFIQRPGDAQLMLEIRDEIAGLMAKIVDCDSPRHAPLYAAWSAADCCARLLAEPPLPRQSERSMDDAPRGRLEAADIDLMGDLYRRVQELNLLMHQARQSRHPSLLSLSLSGPLPRSDPETLRYGVSSVEFEAFSVGGKPPCQNLHDRGLASPSRSIGTGFRFTARRSVMALRPRDSMGVRAAVGCLRRRQRVAAGSRSPHTER